MNNWSVWKPLPRGNCCHKYLKAGETFYSFLFLSSHEPRMKVSEKCQWRAKIAISDSIASCKLHCSRGKPKNQRIFWGNVWVACLSCLLELQVHSQRSSAISTGSGETGNGKRKTGLCIYNEPRTRTKWNVKQNFVELRSGRRAGRVQDGEVGGRMRRSKSTWCLHWNWRAT